MHHILKIFGIAILIFCNGCSSEKEPKFSKNEKISNKVILPIEDDPHSLDPRLGRDLLSATVLRMLFEGLMRVDYLGILRPAAAESVDISEDGTVYTFRIRPHFWSDGTPVTADDFEQTWKSMLSPDFPSPNAYQLYLIKGARAAKEGLISINDVRVKAETPSLLVVELEKATPYFLEATSCHFCFPAHSSARESKIAEMNFNHCIGNGPFKIDQWKRHQEISFEKNPLYWDVNAVKLEGISLQILNENTALQLFKAGHIDWAGSPCSTLPQDSIPELKKQALLQITPGLGIHWFRFNTERFPFDSEKVRRAFSLALDRQALVEHITQGGQLPATGVVPPLFELNPRKLFKDHDVFEAKSLMNEAFSELGSKEAVKIILSYTASDRNHKIAQAVQQQWSKVFNLDIGLENTESKVLLDKMNKGTYQISLGSWYADIRDPINFLELFFSKNNSTNQTFWSSPLYTALLLQSQNEKSNTKRLKILYEAERILINSMPIAPLFFASFNYLKRNSLKEVYFSPLGYLDFKAAFFENPN